MSRCSTKNCRGEACILHEPSNSDWCEDCWEKYCDGLLTLPARKVARNAPISSVRGGLADTMKEEVACQTKQETESYFLEQIKED